ncbi:MAG TPA: GMC family oxidoreductase [Acidobacteriaceae bacterium]|nr:GMC family oxidoreductase [Acidobacteriaceae bacterium]
MIRDLERDRPARDERVDVCVVGAGAAGIVLAVELARLGRRVVLLEGGGAEIEEASQEPYRSEVVGHEHRGVHTGRFRAKGGTTTKWGGQILELDGIDFERREWVSGSGWPFAKSELTRHYERALELEGLRDVEREDGAVWRRLGVAEQRYAELEPYFSRWCPEPNFAVLHRGALEGERIAVWLHANAVGVEMDGERVTAVRARTLGGAEARFEAEEFVFCLGAIESSRFFLQPREGGLPWNASGLLGRHFQDHIDSNAARVRVQDRRWFHERFDNVFLGGFKYHPKLKLTEARQREMRSLNAGATMYFVSEIDEQLAGLKVTAKKILRGKMGEVSGAEIAGLAGNLPLLARQAWRYKTSHRVYNPAEAQVELRVHCEQEPESASSIALGEERDSLGLLRTRLDWRISETEQATIREFALLAREELADVAELEINDALMRNDAAYQARCDDSNHHMGGMRMAASAHAGVVDPELRLHGTKNCFVCSGAVFPTSGFSNPTHTVLALAVRLAEHLATP